MADGGGHGNNQLQQFILRYGPEAGEDGPVRFVTEVMKAEPDPWQAEVLRAFGRAERRIAIKACHGPGKTCVAAWLVVYQILTRFPQKTVATAPAASQLEGALLPEIKTWLKRLPEPVQELLDVKAKKIALEAAPDESFFEARTSRSEKPEALQGVHSNHVLLIADEASGVPEQVYEAAAGSMSGHNATTLLIGNPVRTTGLFFDAFNKLRDMWFTVTVGHDDSPRVTDDFVRDIARRYGEESNAFRIRCLGEFPTSDDDTIIPLEYVESARQRDIELPATARRVWGLDVARFGDDRNALVERTNRGVTNIEVWSGTDLMQTAGRVKERWDSTPAENRPDVVLVDVIGLGAGVSDRLKELSLPVRGINVSESASMSERFLNARTELWWKAREWLAGQGVVLPKREEGADPRKDPAERLADELIVPKYAYTSSGKMKAEAKSEIKKRGYRSPDVADAFVLTFAEDLSLAAFGSSGSTSWTSAIKRNLPGIV